MSDVARADGLAVETRVQGGGRVIAGLAITAIVCLGIPYFAGSYLLSVATTMLFLAYFGQAWNLMMGFAGQLSLGHALYVGVGAYVAGGLYFHYGVSPWLGLAVAIAAGAGFAAVIGALAFRRGVSGIYFALLTIAASEFTRVAFDHMEWSGGPGGMFLKVADGGKLDLGTLRGPPALYYYCALALTVAAFWICTTLLRGRAGYYWLAIREDERAAQALGIDSFRWKMWVVLLSAAMTAVGGVLLAFQTKSLFPEQVFSMHRSLEIMLAPIVGGIGTLGGPIVGAVLLTVLGELITELLRLLGSEPPGLKQIVYGVLLWVTVTYLPQGIWPAIRDRVMRRT